MQKRHFLFILLLGLMALGCKREKIPTLYVNKEMLPYCWFQTRSYWIYEEENTPGLFDSVYVMSTYVSILPDGSDQGYEPERYGNALKLRGRTYGQTRDPWPLKEEGLVYSKLTEGYSDSIGDAADVVFYWNPVNPGILPSNPSGFTMTASDSVIINGQKFFDAYDIQRIPSNAAQQTFRTIWVRNVGVVKRVMTDGTIWNLIRYDIAQ